MFLFVVIFWYYFLFVFICNYYFIFFHMNFYFFICFPIFHYFSLFFFIFQPAVVCILVVCLLEATNDMSFWDVNSPGISPGLKPPGSALDVRNGQAVAAAVNSEIAASMSTFLWLMLLGWENNGKL